VNGSERRLDRARLMGGWIFMQPGLEIATDDFGDTRATRTTLE
jgi:hypothetical protein